MTNQNARAAATFAGQCLYHVHRGVIDSEEGIVICGNDGYSSDKRSRKQVDLLKEKLRRYEVFNYEFATDVAGHSWALFIDNCARYDFDCELYNDEVWRCWFASCDTPSPLDSFHQQHEQRPTMRFCRGSQPPADSDSPLAQ